MKQTVPPTSPVRHRDSNLIEFLRVVSERVNVSPELVAACAQLENVIAPVEGGPFLTVLVRTQGLRIEPHKDALLCLSAQTSQDFEVILLVHSQDDEAIAGVNAVVDRLEPSFLARLTVDVVQGGSRAVPLNDGLARASGRFVTIFDDDDLLMGHWVEAFVRGSKDSSGRMLRAASANQWVEPEMWLNGAAGARTISWPTVDFPTAFVHVDHVLLNRSPFMTWAFPRELFATFGVRFDEELAVCEDWDVILRGAALCGVTDVPELTSIYRRWSLGDSSYNVHQRSEWLESEHRVRARIDSTPLLLPPGSASLIEELLGRVDVMATYGSLFRGNRLRQPLYFGWVAVQPALRFGVRARNGLRRIRRYLQRALRRR